MFYRQEYEEKGLEEAAGISHYQMYQLKKDIISNVTGTICGTLEVLPNEINIANTNLRY